MCGGETPIVVAYLHLVAPLPKKSRDTGIDISSVCCCWVHSSARLSRQVLYDSNKPDATCSRASLPRFSRKVGGTTVVETTPQGSAYSDHNIFYHQTCGARQTQKVTRNQTKTWKSGRINAAIITRTAQGVRQKAKGGTGHVSIGPSRQFGDDVAEALWSYWRTSTHPTHS